MYVCVCMCLVPGTAPYIYISISVYLHTHCVLPRTYLQSLCWAGLKTMQEYENVFWKHRYPWEAVFSSLRQDWSVHSWELDAGGPWAGCWAQQRLQGQRDSVFTVWPPLPVSADHPCAGVEAAWPAPPCCTETPEAVVGGVSAFTFTSC